ncbi:ATP-binding Cassette (ABC) Superfamily [Phytophthora infestans T30-4]|uniref:ATP-binding Cassette (ABC) Superfamily n=1 Tax=Phytophthora infestans (strain T30-4) TaxID=403677 RepID=D0MZL0_PHYIT|nr:ATP-binding Cassette (ABC) Superfamily [Phytophthora infestans T30-4]EEY65673.1 ATP-binding Cassette (ABC) Superfamily [Phytophthora infestans T30-4]|eukprot:XP_002906272.1 ATP-binding Cassette (ABC) Superfamily [Phytophthora infestans T30-4]
MKLFAQLATACFALLASTSLAVQEETKTLDELYADDMAEGGNLVLYHGGDFSSQQDALRDAFIKVFPKINFTLIVDYSKYHNVRIDNQLDNDKLVPDIVALQTLQDFPDWAREGKQLEYKPANFSQIYDGFRDQRGAYMAYMVFTFSFLAQVTRRPRGSAVEGKITSTYPNDDDAVLFLYARYVEKYGWSWVEDFANQNVTFCRGSNTASDLVTAKEKVIGVGTYSQGTPNVTFVTDGGNEYLAWGQRIAILSKAKHPAAAKLFMNWAISEKVQKTILPENVRVDLTPNSGSSHPWEIRQANVDEFPKFMADRASVEQWHHTFSLYLGEVQGEQTPGFLGLYPGL